MNGMNDEAITAKVFKELMFLKDTSEVCSEQVLVWVECRGKKGTETSVTNLRHAIYFDLIRRDRHRLTQNKTAERWCQ